MIKIFSFLFLIFAIVVRSELTLERIDAITDLSGIAKKFFSEEPNLMYEEPSAKMINAFVWSVSDLWDENESALYVLTRLAKLVDEKDASGELSVHARVIRSFAEKSEARKVYFTTTAESSTLGSCSSSYDAGIREDEEIERLFMAGREDEADAKVARMIVRRWSSMDKAVEDIETAAKNGHFRLMAALIKQGANRDTLRFIAPELKAGLIIKLLSLPGAKIQPATAKWLFTMDTYREEQLKLVKTIEKALKKRATMGQEKTMTPWNKNNLEEMFGEIETIERGTKNAETKADYFNGIASIDVDTISKPFYKTAKPQRTFNKQKKNLKLRNLEKAAKVEEKEKTVVSNIQELKEQKEKTVISVQEMKEQEQPAKEKQQEKTTEIIDIDQQKEANQEQPQQEKERNFFEEKEEREREIEQVVYETNDDPLYDNDGEYDDQEKKSDRAAQIAVIAIVGSIVATAVGVYVYLRARRARRNRTMLVVTEALETVA